ncbi:MULTISPECIES: hypothetical protein [unclassified Bradyrhizobium]|uniref:hypothetical protein n=1 Tax=unclassified Bradyrhizobium TaxID=2631580 RepID=UPI0024792CDE|nr:MULTISPECIES: hypothetical protein [unclassified Bradyrhizobium]WGS20766.1 hypothetical protein MTX22_02835 [Bradyrhizobium sp. ISRA463]WGS27661.1 hypothetical protein MTX19_00705 [Bradyrhizobium sp. ISRA464]
MLVLPEWSNGRLSCEGVPVSAMFGSWKPEIQTNISKESFDIFDSADLGEFLHSNAR